MRWIRDNKPSHSLRGHLLGSSTEYKSKLTIILGKTLIWMTSDLETNTENAHTKLQTQAPRTNATSYRLPTSRLSALRTWLCRTYVLEAWRWHGHNNNGQQTIFSWEEEGRGIESPPIKGTMKLHALRKPSTFRSEEVSPSQGLIGTWDTH